MTFTSKASRLHCSKARAPLFQRQHWSSGTPADGAMKIDLQKTRPARPLPNLSRMTDLGIVHGDAVHLEVGGGDDDGQDLEVRGKDDDESGQKKDVDTGDESEREERGGTAGKNRWVTKGCDEGKRITEQSAKMCLTELQRGVPLEATRLILTVGNLYIDSVSEMFP